MIRPAPSHAHIEPTTFCDLACVGCILPTVKKERKGHLTPDRLVTFLERIPSLTDVSLVGLGEPTLNPHLPALASILKERGIRCRTATNGMSLHRIDSDKLLSSFDQVVVSLDGVSKSVFESIRVQSDFDRVVANVKGFTNRKKNRGGGPALLAHAVISRMNHHEISGMPAFVRGLGLEGIQFVTAIQYYPELSGNPSEEYRAFQSQIAGIQLDGEVNEQRLLDQLEQACRAEGLSFSVSTSEKKTPDCWWPKRGIYITFDGYLTPCCLRMDPTVFNFGNILTQSLEEIQSSPTYTEFQRAFAERRSPEICGNCPL